VRYIPSGILFARVRVKGKLIRQSLKTKTFTVGKLRLGDFEKKERHNAEHNAAFVGGKMTFEDALVTAPLPHGMSGGGVYACTGAALEQTPHGCH